MKYLIVGLLIFPQFVLASFTECPAHIKTQPREDKAVSFLKYADGHYYVGGCKVEIHVCSGAAESTDDAVTDVLLTSSEGRQTYMAVYFPRIRSSKISTKMTLSDQTFHYEFDNTTNGEITGRLESNKLEIIEDPKTHKVQSIVMGTYNTKEAQKHMEQYTYLWNECGI